MKRMTMKDRILAVIRGQPHDRIPFVMYDGIVPKEEAWSLVGRDGMGLIRWCHPYRVDTPTTRFEETVFEQDGRQVKRTVLLTPRGSLTAVYHQDPGYGSWACQEHFVKELADYDVMDAHLAEMTITPDPDSYHQAEAELGEDGIPMVSVFRNSWQFLWVQWVGVQDLACHFAEDEDRVMRSIGLIERIQRRLFDCVCASKPPFVDFPDNITAPMIGPDKFARFCLPMYRELSARVAEYAGAAYCHMDGDLKPLWELIGRSGLHGLDSFSPPPDNDTGVADALRLWPEMRLHMNFPSSVHTRSPSEIRQRTQQILGEGGHSGRLLFQISENVPAWAWRTSFPVIAQELTRFGAP